VVIENWRSVPPSSSNVAISSIAVPPRSSSSANVRAMSSTSKLSVPTPSGCLVKNRPARPVAPGSGSRGALHTTTTLPAAKHAERWPLRCSSSGDDRQVSAKSSFSV
jgi:hypothetical protein